LRRIEESKIRLSAAHTHEIPMVNKFTATTEQQRSDEDVEADPRERYRRVLSVIDAQTSPKQQPGVRPRVLYTVLVAHSDYSRSGVKSSLQATLNNNDALAYRDPDGDLRFCLREPAAVERLVGVHPGAADNDAVGSVLEGGA